MLDHLGIKKVADDTLQLYHNAEFAASTIPGARLVRYADLRLLVDGRWNLLRLPFLTLTIRNNNINANIINSHSFSG